MSNKPMRITITFKESERDLYEELSSHSVPGGYIKDILKGCGNNFHPQAKGYSQPTISKAGFIGILGDD